MVGQMHIDLWQRLMGALNDDRQFLPVTEALLSRPNAGSAEFEFVAVNRNQISYLAKME